MEQLKIWGNELISATQEALENLIAFLPMALLAMALIIVGWLLARALRNLAAKAIERFDWSFRGDTAGPSEKNRASRKLLARAVSALVFWTVILSFVATALKSLGWPVIESWTEGLLAYLPVLVAGIAIILLGFVGGSLVREIVEPAASSFGLAYSGAIGRLSQVAIITTGIVIGTGQLGVDVTFIVQLATVIVGTALAGLALALALGVRRHLSNLVGIRYARKHFHTGEQLCIGEYRGRVIDMSDGWLFLETEEGDVSIPGRYFTREPSVKLTTGVNHDR
jgi:hypothetical protein